MFNKVKAKEVNQFTRDLAIMLRAGIMLTAALKIIRSQGLSSELNDIVRRVEGQVVAGNSFCETLKQYPQAFNSTYVNLVEVGELGGNLAEMLERLVEYQMKIAELKRKLIQAMTYPSLVISVAVFCTLFLLVYVVPTFEEILNDFGGELPWITQTIVGISATLQAQMFPLAGGVTLMLIIIWRLRHHTKFRQIRDKLLLNVPFIGGLISKNHISHFCRTLGTLLTGGVSLLKALEISSRSTSNVLIGEQIVRMKGLAARGEGLAGALNNSSVFPLMVTQMIAVGEETAELPNMLLSVSDYYDRDIDSAIETLGSVIEPIVIVILGLVIGVILISIYLPLFNMTSVIG